HPHRHRGEEAVRQPGDPHRGQLRQQGRHPHVHDLHQALLRRRPPHHRLPPLTPPRDTRRCPSLGGLLIKRCFRPDTPARDGAGGEGAAMTVRLPDVAAKKKSAEESAEAQAAAELVRLAREQGLSLTGPDGLLKQLTKTVIETALQEEMTEHLGYEKHDPVGAGTGNITRGARTNTVRTETSGRGEIEVRRDRAGTFIPQIVKKRQRRLSGVDGVVLSLYAKGLTTGEISAHFAEIYGAQVSKETISRITDRV